MQLPQALLNSLESVNGFNEEAFIKVHESEERVTSIRMNPFKLSAASKVLPFGEDLGGAFCPQTCILIPNFDLRM